MSKGSLRLLQLEKGETQRGLNNWIKNWKGGLDGVIVAAAEKKKRLLNVPCRVAETSDRTWQGGEEKGQVS